MNKEVDMVPAIEALVARGYNRERAERIVEDAISITNMFLNVVDGAIRRRNEAKMPIIPEAIALGIQIYGKHFLPHIGAFADEADVSESLEACEAAAKAIVLPPGSIVDVQDVDGEPPTNLH